MNSPQLIGPAPSISNGGNNFINPPNQFSIPNGENFDSYFQSTFASPFEKSFGPPNQESSDSTSDYGPPPEQQRGGSLSPPVLLPLDREQFDEDPYHHLEPVPDSSSDDSAFEPGSLYEEEEPLEVRRRIPGCGVNHFDRGDNSVRAETSPVRLGDYFGRVRTYARPANLPLRRPLPPSFRYGIHPSLHRLNQQTQRLPLSAILEDSETVRQEMQEQHQRRIIRDPRYPYFNGQLSPCTSLSSSSSSSSSFSSFQPIHHSTALQTPPHQMMDVNPRDNQHPAYIPSFVVRSPENFYPSPASVSPPSFMGMSPPDPQLTYTVPPQQINPGFGATHPVPGPSSSSEGTSSSGNTTVKSTRRHLNF